tara:strand:- start:1508 stop:1666 length:159 start_codon:yes stop_codon:yes gene_type:complete
MKEPTLEDILNAVKNGPDSLEGLVVKMYCDYMKLSIYELLKKKLNEKTNEQT